MDSFKFLNRDNFHYILLACVLVFGLASGPIGHVLRPGDPAVLYWWPTGFGTVWIGISVTLLVILLIGRSQVLEQKVPLFHVWVGVGAVLVTLVALWTVSLCRVSVYADRIERRTVTGKGFQTVVYPYDKVMAVKYDCIIANDRGLVHTNTAYILEFPYDETINLGEGRNDGRDHGRWIGAIGAADTALAARHVNITGLNGRDNAGPDFDKCMAMLATERTPEETAILQRAFQPSTPAVKKKKRAA